MANVDDEVTPEGVKFSRKRSGFDAQEWAAANRGEGCLPLAEDIVNFISTHLSPSFAFCFKFTSMCPIFSHFYLLFVNIVNS